MDLRGQAESDWQTVVAQQAQSSVYLTGVRDGDWWQLSARVDGKDVEGWSSSLWLRRTTEGGTP